MIDSGLRARVEWWISDDPDERDRAELRALLDAADSGGDGAADADSNGDGNGNRNGHDSGDGYAERELRDRFAGRLEFGTAGLRGRIGAGPNRMNRAVVRATTAAVVGWLADRAGAGSHLSTGPYQGGRPYPGAGPYQSALPYQGTGPHLGTGQYPGAGPYQGTGPYPGAGPYQGAPPGNGGVVSVVVGCDARHRSEEFADEVAAVLAGAGIHVHLLPRPCPTPLLAFAVRHLAARAGIMITASHNPAADNGYKLYLGDGAQIIPPTDAEVSERIGRLGPLAAIPTASLDESSEGADAPPVTWHGDEVAKAYLRAAAVTLAEAAGRGPEGFARPDRSGGPPLTVVYTPLHGVAGTLMLRAIERAGLAVPHVVKAQADPDPDFPTVAFPNPEEPGALDLALEEAASVGADLVLASDPDGDRLSVAVPDDVAASDNRGWRQLTGDQLGALLGAYLLRPRTLPSGSTGIPGSTGLPASTGLPGNPGGDDPRAPMVATTIVSGTLLREIAAAAGAGYAETLTGFKWISRAGDGHPESALVFGYEEALGYMVGQVVRDKDGIGAALAVLAMAAEAKAEGRTLLDRYDDLEREHGVHLTEQLSLRIGDTSGTEGTGDADDINGTSGTGAVMRQIRSAPPAELGGLPVTGITDYSEPGTGLPPSDVLRFTLDGARVAIRPSGTEPKIKSYLEVIEPVPDDPAGLTAARAAAAARLAPLRAAVAALLDPPPGTPGTG